MKPASRALTELALACAVSVLLYAAVFATLLDRPLDLGFLEREIDVRIARGAALPSPKLVILAGSNGPYSHRCAVIEPILGMPCVNAGVAVGVGLDYLFLRWERLLHPGDVVYMPMEIAQYTRSRPANRVGPDAAIMFRHDRDTLGRLPPDRWLGALFAFDLRAAALSVVEAALAGLPVQARRAAVIGETNDWGDHVGHARSILDPGAPTGGEPVEASAINSGYGARLIDVFVRWAFAHRVRVIGGLATTPEDQVLPDDVLMAIRAVFEAGGGQFLLLDGRSRYSRAAFFDSPDHLIEPCQITHSVRVAAGLAAMLNRTPQAAPATSADACPG